MTLPPSESLLQAALTIRRTGFRHFPVVEGDRLVGVVSERDVNRCAPSLLTPITPEEYNTLLESTSIGRVMTRNPITISPDTSVRDAAAILFARKLGCLPVVEGGKVVGILTVIDMLRLLHRLLGGEAATAEG